MGRVLLGIMIGLLPLAGWLGYQHFLAARDPCRGHCAGSTVCVEGKCVAPGPVKTRPARKSRRRPARARRPAGDSDPPALRRPSAAEASTLTSGPALTGTDVLNLADREERGELSSEEVDRKFRALDGPVVACIDRARGDLDLSGLTVTVRFRVERSGRVQKVQIAAPAVMQRAGLAACVRPLVTGLRFAPSAGSLVLSYPFKLR